MSRIADISDFRTLARRRLPGAIRDYVEGGAGAETTLARNRRALDELALLPRVALDVSRRRLETAMLGAPATMPIGLAPIGSCGFVHHDGEIAAAKAAKAAGVPFSLSTLSIASIEDVAAGAGPGFWFQLYPIRDRTIMEELIARAEAAGCSALLLSLDLHVAARRNRDVRNSKNPPVRITVADIADGLSHPGWLIGMATAKRRTFGNLEGRVPGVQGWRALVEWIEKEFDASFSLDDVAAIRKRWRGPLAVKGVMHAEDARLAKEAGCDAVIVSNHGGRQLDGAASTIEALPEIRRAVGTDFELIADSGVRSGVDALKMIANGADSCLVGRAFLYGLAAEGEAGVAKVLSLLRREFEDAMALSGIIDLQDLPEHLVHREHTKAESPPPSNGLRGKERRHAI